jgi:hypothetical protein
VIYKGPRKGNSLQGPEIETMPMSHCDRGMVFAINPGESMNTFLDNISKTHIPTW